MVIKGGLRRLKAIQVQGMMMIIWRDQLFHKTATKDYSWAFKWKVLFTKKSFWVSYSDQTEWIKIILNPLQNNELTPLLAELVALCVNANVSIYADVCVMYEASFH